MKSWNWFARPFMIGMCTMLLIISGCTSSKDKEKTGDDFKVGMVTDTGGLKDQSFNQTTWKGCNDCKDKFGADTKALESKRDEDYVPNLTRLAREPRDLIWATGFKFTNSLPEVAKKFSDVRFGIIDSNLGGKIPSNVIAVTFKDEESSFLAGVVAGLTTKTDKVGMIGGINSEVIERFYRGFEAGVKASNPKAEVMYVCAESFTDSAKGLSLARTMYNSGIDIIFHAAGGVGKGVFDEVKTRQSGKYWAIGVDCDQSVLAPNHTLTSVVKSLDVVVFDITKKCKAGQFDGGKEMRFGLKEGAVGIIEGKWLDVNVKKEVEKYKHKIIQGEIKVPETKGQSTR